jgi:streptogramin lyase
VVDGDAIYATTDTASSIARISIERAPSFVIGAQATTLGGFTTPASLALDADFIYVTESQTSAIRRLAKNPDAGADAILAQAAGKPHDIVVAGDALLWLDDDGLRKMSKQGPPILTITNAPGKSFVYNAELRTVHWQQGETLLSMPIAGGQIMQTRAPMLGEESRVPLATDGASIIFATSTKFYRAPEAELFAHASGYGSTPRSIIVDSDAYYWIRSAAIWRRPK